VPKTTTTRASAPASSPGKGMQKEILGQPAWLWAVGAVVLVGGYLYLRSHSSSSASGQQKPAGSGQRAVLVGSPTGLSLEQFLLLLQDMHGSGHMHSRKQPPPRRPPKKKDHDKDHGGDK
jgi:hypothetical protein